MLYYGYAFSQNDVSRKTVDVIEQSVECGLLHTGYSVSAYEPELAIFGIVVHGSDDLFCAVPLEEAIECANKQGRSAAAEVANGLAMLPDETREKLLKHAYNKKPEFLFCVMSDD